MPGSLLLIAVVWLVLLAPLLLRNQRPVRRTAQALSETRVVMAGDSEEQPQSGRRMPTLRKLRPAESLYQPSDDDDLELVDAEPEYVIFDEDSDTQVVDGELVTGRPAKKFRGRRLGKLSSRSYDDAANDEAGNDRVADAEAGQDTSVITEPGDAVTVYETPAQATDESDESEATRKGADRDGDDEANSDATADHSDDRATDEHTADADAIQADATEAEASDDETEDTSDAPAAETGEGARIPAAYFRGGDVDTTVEMDDQMEEPQFSSQDSDYLTHSQELELESAEITDEDIAYSNSRKGRGVYNPVASQALVQQRQKRRAQVLAVLAALTVLSGVLAFTVGHSTWIIFAAILAFTVFYLGLLRHTAVEEARLRRRRLARMRRARLGVRNAEDPELGIPDRLRRPGAVIVEADDMDPEFQHLGFIDGAAFFGDDDRDRGYVVAEHEHHARAV